MNTSGRLYTLFLAAGAAFFPLRGAAQLYGLPDWTPYALVYSEFVIDEDYGVHRLRNDGYGADLVADPHEGYVNYRLTVANRAAIRNTKHVWLGYSYATSAADPQDAFDIEPPDADGLGRGSPGSAAWTQTAALPPLFVWKDADNKSRWFEVVTWDITPQPRSEWFYWLNSGDAVLKTVTVLTYCTVDPPRPIPEPAATGGAGALVCAAVCLWRRRGSRRISCGDPAARAARPTV